MARYALIKLDDPDETKVRNNSANKLRHHCARDESKIKRNSSSSLFGTYDGCDLSFPVTVAFLSARKPEKTIIERETAPVSLSFLHSLTTHTGCFFWNKSAWEGRKKKEKKRRVDAVHHPGNNVKEFRKVAPGLSLSLSIDHTKTKTRLDRVFSVCSFMHSV